MPSEAPRSPSLDNTEISSSSSLDEGETPKDLAMEPGNSHKEDDDDSEEEIIIGQTPLDPLSTERCWACFVRFRDEGAASSNGDNAEGTSYYTTHDHPLLGIVVCSVCHDAGEDVERRILEERDNNTGTGHGDDDGSNSDEESEQFCSFCSLPSSQLDPPYPPLADDQPNDLFLCDSCPRAFCQKCICILEGGTQKDLERVRSNANSDEEWKCCVCSETEFYKKLKRGYASLLETTSDGEEDEDSRIARLIDELHGAESKYVRAQRQLEDGAISLKRKEIQIELSTKYPTPSSFQKAMGGTFSSALEEEVERYRQLWIENSERIQETIGKLQNELEEGGVNVLDVYRFWKEEGDGFGVKDGESDEEMPGWKYEADLALDKRDVDEGFGKGEFRGATGYKAKDTRIYKLEPEDLNPTCLKEIEDINTTEGAITQMNRLKSHQESSNQWGSKTGITADDIEMFEKKCTKFEELTLGDKIDLKALESNCIKDKDDEVLDKKAGVTITVRRKNGNGRVVQRTATVQSVKMQNEKESISALLSGDSKEYNPRIPQPQREASVAAVSKQKKRAQLIHSSSSLSLHVLPAMKGMLIGTDVPFVDSDISLPVKQSTIKLSICKPLASLLKKHQIEGVKFCWKRICENLFEGGGDVRGAILAHSMGVGKSIQTVSLLHTLLTHPALVRSAASSGGSTNTRIIQKALLIAPVNTLANWTAEFQKWIGESSGNSLPFIRFYSWDEKVDKVKLIKEWHEHGGIMCVSSSRYAATVSKIEKDGTTKEKKGGTKEKKDGTKEKRGGVSVEHGIVLYKALVEPGPDIVVLDEAHTMLKNSSSSIFKNLSRIATKLRLSLTGTPLQNNLMEYYRMANWTSPGILGTEARFTFKYEKPIMAGMAADCSLSQAQLQEHLSSELHQILSCIVHRCSREVLRKALPFKQEVIIHIRQSKAQAKLYREFKKYKRANDVSFWEQYHALRPVSNHPACLPFFRDKSSRSNSPTSPENDNDHQKAPGDTVEPKANDDPQKAPDDYAWFCDICKTAKFETLEEAEEHEASCTASPGEVQIYENENKEWWRTFHDNVTKSGLDINKIEHGGKVVVLLQILAHSDTIGDKVVVFSQCLKTLDFIEEVLQSSDWGGFTPYLSKNKTRFGGWKRNSEYSRIDGSVDANSRGELINTFNAAQNSKLFLVSTVAGGVGINLVGANRVVLFDTHWNPAISDQAIHRCYRFGQTKPVYCYRLLAEGSMEEKIFSRAATKTFLSDLVIDAKNIDRLFTQREMDLLQANDTWVGCESCGKWRMLPPDGPDEEVENLPEKWYCKDNVHDPDRSSCDAAEQDGLWYANFWESRRKEEQGNSLTPIAAPKSSNESLVRFTKRDIVLQTLLSLCEGTTAKNSKQATNSWISKYDFSKETLQAADADDVEEAKKAAAQKAKSSPKKKKQVEVKQPSRTSPRKSKAGSPKKEKQRSDIFGHDGADKVFTGPGVTLSEKVVSPARFRIPRKNVCSETSGDNDKSGNGTQDCKKAKKDRSRRASVPTSNAGKVLQAKHEHVSSPKKSSSQGSIGGNSAVVPKRKSLPLQKSLAAKKSSKLNSGVKAAPKVEQTIDLCDSD